jgi:L-ascorbate metabolism protein UlaG (beta-lactamase superfamily)
MRPPRAAFAVGQHGTEHAQSIGARVVANDLDVRLVVDMHAGADRDTAAQHLAVAA